jgi:dTMP kinase
MSGPRGVFITIEGIEGAGKSTQAARLAQAVRAAGHAVIETREPGGGGRVGETLRQLLKDPSVWESLQLSEIFLYAAARAQHLESTILPALEQGQVVICDRYLDSTRAYQGNGRGRPQQLIEALHQLAPLCTMPARTVLLDLAPASGLQRARNRTDQEQHRGYDDADEQFFERVRAGFLAIAQREPQRVVVIDAAQAPDVVHAQVVSRLAELIPGLAPVPVGR